jgi:hypothetical protein
MNSGRFTYAGIFCAVAFFLGALLIVSPQIVDRLRDRRENLEAKRLSMAAPSERSSVESATRV